MKNFLLIGVLMLFFGTLQAQEPACVPDTAFAGFDAGVYPLPRSEMFPDQGVTDSACINQAFEFVFTVVTPDTISIPFGGLSITSPLDSIAVAAEGAIGGLPMGIDYACDPPNCTFTSEVGIGCIVLRGTPTDAEQTGENPLTIMANVYLPALSIPINFPDSTLFPGSYSLYVNATDSEACSPITGVEDQLEEISQFQISPNPTTGRAEIQFESLENGDYLLETFNLLGEKLQTRSIRLLEGKNRINYEGAALNAGMYILSLSNGNKKISRRMVIHR